MARSKEELREMIRTCRSLTDKPFGVNIPIIALDPDTINSYVDCCAEEGVRVVETGAQNPKPYAERIKKAGLVWLHKCASLKHAQSGETAGIDAVSLVGYEAAGHTGQHDLPHSIMIPLAKDTLNIPVIAAGGVSDGRGLAALLAVGADGVQVGTRFMATKECRAHPKFKEWLLQSEATDTVHVERPTGTPYRVRRNAAVEQILEIERRGAPSDEIAWIIARQDETLLGGDLDAAPVACGQAVGLMKDIVSVKEAVDRMVGEARDILKRLAAD